MSTAAKKQASPERRAMLGKIHIAQKDLALEEESYRDLLEKITGKRSSSKCTHAQLHDVIEEFKRLGWKPKKGQPKRAGRRKLAEGEQASKIRALWLDLYHLGALRDPGEEALAAFVARCTGVEALQWLDTDSADKAIKALRGWLERIGFVFPDAERRKALATWRAAAGLPEAPAGFADKVALLECQWQRIRDSGTMRFGFFADLGSWLAKHHGAAAAYFLTPERADAAIEDLGRWVRKVVEP